MQNGGKNYKQETFLNLEQMLGNSYLKNSTRIGLNCVQGIDITGEIY